MRLLFAQAVAYTERLELPLRGGLTLGCIASVKGNTGLDKNKTKRSSRFDVKVWKRHLRLSSRLERGGLDVALLPLNVSHVKESEVVF